MAIKILEICKVTPSPMSPTEISIPLAFFDLIWLRFPPIELLFFYETTSLSETLLPRLKNSLSLTLHHFLPLSGNLVWQSSSPNPIIHYKKGDGIFFTAVQSDADFDHFSRIKFRETKKFRPLVAELSNSGSQVPLLAIKITFFLNKGFCIGITHHHVAMDGAVCTMFYKSWASISKFCESTILSPKFTPMFDRNLVRERHPHLEKLYINYLLKQEVNNPRSLAIMKVESRADRVRGTFHISGSDINNLKIFVRKHEEINSNVTLTTFTLTLAYIIVCSAKAKEKKGNKVGFGIVVDCRAKLEPPLSPSYAGNCIGFAGGDVEREKLEEEDGMIAAVKAVNKMRKNINEGVLKGAEKWLEEIETDTIYTAGSTNMDVYGADFGWGRPKKVDIVSIDTSNAISLVEGRDGGGGIEMELCLAKHEMEKFACVFAQGLNKFKLIKASL